MTHSYNIALHLANMAQKMGERPALLIAKKKHVYDRFSFQELNTYSDELSVGFQALGLKKGAKAVVMVKPGISLFALVFGLFKAGIAPVLVDPGMGLKGLKECLDQAKADIFIGIPLAHLLRSIMGWSKSSHLTIMVSNQKHFHFCDYHLDQIRTLGRSKYNDFQAILDCQADELAAILFTSGSTGTPKGAVYRHGNFWAQVEFLKQMYDFEGFEYDLPTFPLFALFDPALGMTAVLPQMDYSKPVKANPQNIFDCIDDFKIQHLFCSPALLKKISKEAYQRNYPLSSLKRVISAGASVGIEDMCMLGKQMAVNPELSTPYGATESLPVAYISQQELLSNRLGQTDGLEDVQRYQAQAFEYINHHLVPEDFVLKSMMCADGVTRAIPSFQPLADKYSLAFANYLGCGICVGRIVKGVDVLILEISDQPVNQLSDLKACQTFEIGEIVVKSPATTLNYAQRPDADLISKIHDTQGIYHRMGDVGYFDDLGQLWLCGRKTHRVDQGEKRYFSQICEGIFDSHPKVKRSALAQALWDP